MHTRCGHKGPRRPNPIFDEDNLWPIVGCSGGITFRLSPVSDRSSQNSVRPPRPRRPRNFPRPEDRHRGQRQCRSLPAFRPEELLAFSAREAAASAMATVIR